MREAAMNPALPLYQPADGLLPETLEAWLERDSGVLAEASRKLLALDLRNLAKVELRLRCPVYLRGRRRGKPMHPEDVMSLEARLERLHAAIAFYRAIIARAESGPTAGASA